MYMKKILMAIVALAVSSSAFALEKKYGSGWFQFESSAKNTSAAEMPISAYKKGSLVFLRNDTAYMFYPQPNMDMGDLKVCPELTELKIEGTFAYDGKRNKLYFVKKTGNEATVIYEATAEGDKWKQIKQLKIDGTLAEENKIIGSTLTAGRYNFTHPGAKGFHNLALAEGGDRIYFSGDFKAGQGGRDLWYIDRSKDGKSWSRPMPAADSINTNVTEDYPLVVGDTSLFFSSNRPGGMGGLDLYVAHKAVYEKTWGPVKNLGEVFNSSADDYNIAYCRTSMYFISDRIGGAGSSDIYYPEHYGFHPIPELATSSTIEEPSGFNWVLFFFDFNKSDMKPEYEVQLGELVKAMQEFSSNESFVIYGYTDNRGSYDYNLALSQKRAEYIRQLLISRGFDGHKLKAVGRGMNDPVIPDAQTEDEHEQNRRVEIRLMGNQ